MGAPEIPTQEPTQFYAGDSVQWNKTLAQWPASNPWFLSYAFTSAQYRTVIAAVADGDAYAISISPADSAKFIAGDFTWSSYIVDDQASPTQRYTLATAELVVLPNLPALQVPLDTRSHARRMIEAIEALLEGKATKDQQEYTIAGRSLRRIELPDLMQWYNFYRDMIRQEDADQAAERGDPVGGKLVPRFIND